MQICASSGDDSLINFLSINNGKILGQGHPGSTPAAIYTLPVDKTAIVKTILVCNTDASAHTYRLFVSAIATYDATTALFFDAPLDANETKLITLYLPLAAVGSTLAARSDSTTVTFTLAGDES